MRVCVRVRVRVSDRVTGSVLEWDSHLIAALPLPRSFFSSTTGGSSGAGSGLRCLRADVLRDRTLPAITVVYGEYDG